MGVWRKLYTHLMEVWEVFCNFQSHSKMFMIWSLTTWTDGDHKRWMKHVAMNLHVRRRSLYVCVYVYYILTFFDLSTHAGGTHNIPVNSDPDASFTFRCIPLEEAEFCRLWQSEFEALADPTKWLGINIYRQFDIYRMTFWSRDTVDGHSPR